MGRSKDKFHEIREKEIAEKENEPIIPIELLINSHKFNPKSKTNDKFISSGGLQNTIQRQLHETPAGGEQTPHSL